MLCTNCKREQATLFYTQNINGKESSAALCPACAKKAGIHNTDILSPLFTQQNAPRRETAKRCSLCGLSFRDVLAMGKVGCPACYESFQEELDDTIRSLHGGAKHCGLTPLQEGCTEKTEFSEEAHLRDALKKAIQEENYEEAAKLRDAIKMLKGEN